MDFALTEQRGAIKNAVAEVAARYGPDYFPWDFYDTLAEGGRLGIAIPELYGGGGLGIQEAGLLVEEIAASGAAMNGRSAIHLTIFGVNVVVKHGTEELRHPPPRASTTACASASPSRHRTPVRAPPASPRSPAATATPTSSTAASSGSPRRAMPRR